MPEPGWGMLPLVLMPLVFFGLAALFMKRYPFDVPELRRWVDGKFGGGVYTGLIAEVKPLLLFAVGALASGVLSLYAPVTTMVGSMRNFAAFMVSAGVAFLIMRVILARRGLSMESPGAKAPWSGKEFVPASILRIQATNRTAFLAGAWTALGMSTAEAVEKLHKLDPQTSTLVFLGTVIPFVAVPVFIFVFGIQNRPPALEGESYLQRRSRIMGQQMIRGLCWMGGALVFSLVWMPLLGLLLKA